MAVKTRLRTIADTLSRQRWLRFGLVGGVGFGVDGLVLAVLYHGFGFDALAVRAASFSSAVLVTWLLNRAYTFGASKKGAARTEFLRYLAANGVGLAVNVVVYTAAVTGNSYLGEHPVLALVLAAAFAAVTNYIGAARFVFVSRQD